MATRVILHLLGYNCNLYAGIGDVERATSHTLDMHPGMQTLRRLPKIPLSCR